MDMVSTFHYPFNYYYQRLIDYLISSNPEFQVDSLRLIRWENIHDVSEYIEKKDV